MNQRNKLKFLILFIVVPCIIFGKGTYKPRSLSSTFIIGHDSNPLRLSQNENDQLSEKPYFIRKISINWNIFLKCCKNTTKIYLFYAITFMIIKPIKHYENQHF